MKKIIITAIQALLFTLLSLPVLSAEPEISWQLEKQKNGIKVFLPADKKLTQTFKGETVMKARMETVAALMRDIPAATQWMADTVVADVIEAIDEYRFVVHNVTNLPWPASDREMVVNTSVVNDYTKGTSDIYMQAVAPDAYRDRLSEDRVYMHGSQISYHLQYIDREHTKVVYQARLNIGGSLPMSAIQRAMVDLPFTTLSNMRQMLKKAKYIEAGAKSEDRKKIEQALLQRSQK